MRRFFEPHAEAVLVVLLTVPGVLRAQADGGILTWGVNLYGMCDVPEPNEGFIAIAGGWNHSLGLKENGFIVAWGIDDGGTSDWGQVSDAPTEEGGFVSIGSAIWHGLAIREDGSVAAWGRNDEGQCEVPEPNSGFVAVSGGFQHSIGLKEDGSIVAWGQETYGQCEIPEPNTGFVAIAAGSVHNVALREDGSLVAWGWNEDGQCDVPEPNEGFVAIAGAGWHSLGIKEDGSIVAWGYNEYGQCDVPEPNSGFLAVAGGTHHSFGLREDGIIIHWGWEGWGGCHVPPPNFDGLVTVWAGYLHNMALWGVETSVQNDAAGSEPQLRLALRPNPFSTLTEVEFHAPNAACLTLTIYDTAGRLVNTRELGTLPAGTHTTSWDGSHTGGAELPSGVYFVYLQSPDQQVSTKVVLVR